MLKRAWQPHAKTVHPLLTTTTTTTNTTKAATTHEFLRPNGKTNPYSMFYVFPNVSKLSMSWSPGVQQHHLSLPPKSVFVPSVRPRIEVLLSSLLRLHQLPKA